MPRRLAAPRCFGYCRGVIQPIRRATPVLMVAALSLSTLAGCPAKRTVPTAMPTGDQAPVALRDIRVETVETHRAVLLRLTRVPTLVRASSSRSPAEITVQAWGPDTGGDLAERVVPLTDPQIRGARVGRTKGGLYVVLEFIGTKPPTYTVHEMADWIMVRLEQSGEGS